MILRSIAINSLSLYTKDSLNFYLGVTALLLNKTNEADLFFDSVTDTSSSIYTSKFIVRNFYALKNFGSLFLPKVNEQNPIQKYHLEVLRLQILANCLLRNDTKQFMLVYDKNKCSFDNLNLAERRLYECYQKTLLVPKKKQWKAVVLSAMIPGLGKLYAGKKGEALTAFLPVLINGAQAYEGYAKAGVNSPHLYIFGGIGTVFYFSNLYGAKQAVIRSIDEQHEQVYMEVREQLRILDIGFY